MDDEPDWQPVLHWCLRIMDGDDPDVGFVASLLAHACSHGRLTPKQAWHASRISQRVMAAFRQGTLLFQRMASDAERLADMEAMGSV